MSPEERSACGVRLAAIIPLLAEYKPEGWVDFREPMRPDWRGGIFVKGEGDSVKFKALFGSLGQARMAAYFIGIVSTWALPTIKAPEDAHGYYQVDFEVAESEVCW